MGPSTYIAVNGEEGLKIYDILYIGGGIWGQLLTYCFTKAVRPDPLTSIVLEFIP